MRLILARHASGQDLTEISRELFVSYSAVCGIVKDIKRRLEARNLASCVLRAHSLGYISDPDPAGAVHPVLPDGKYDPRRGG